MAVVPAAASLAALGPQLTHHWAARVRLVAPVAAPLAALDPQLTPDGAALVALEVGNHRQAPCWAALVTLVAPVAAPLAALGLQQTPAGVALACRLGRQPRHRLKHWLLHRLKCTQEHWRHLLVSGLVSNQAPECVHTCKGILVTQQIPIATNSHILGICQSGTIWEFVTNKFPYNLCQIPI